MNSIVACQILKLQKDCSVEDLKSAFRKLSLQFHPDKNKNKSPGASEQFLQIKQAYEFLLNLKMDDPNFAESFSTQNQPPPTEFKLDLTLEEIISGCTRKEKIYRRVLDEYGIVDRMEEKILDVKVKPGTLAGTRITIKNQGDIHHDKIPANVVFIVREKPHELFTRSKFDLKYTATITSEDAIFGCDLLIPTLNNKVLRPLLLNEKIDEKTEKRITGYGLPVPDNPEKRGDIIVTFKVVNSMQSNAKNSQNKEKLPPNKHNLVLTLDEIFHGCVKSEKIEFKILFKNAKERKEEKILQVNVNPGLISGSEIVCKNAGDMCFGKIAADVIFTVIVQKHHIFESNGHDLEYFAKITSKEAILGGALDIPTLENKLFRFVFDGGIFPETTKRIPKMGLPKDANQRGDLIVSFQILFEACTSITKNTPLVQLPPNKFNLNLTLEEIFHGCKKYQKIKIKIIDQNGTERIDKKSLKVKIKPGSLENIVFPFEGDRKYGMIPADVIFTIVEEPHVLFKRNGHNLEYSAKITPKEAITGDKVMIPTLDRELVELPFEKGVKPGSQFRIPKKGLPDLNSQYKRGDIIVRFEIMFENTPQPASVEEIVLISLEEVLKGCRKKYLIKRKIIDSTGLELEETKTFTIDIKPGIEADTRFTFPREGDQQPGMIPADVVFIIRDKPHELLTRNGTDIEHIVTLKESELINGGTIKIPTLEDYGSKQIWLNKISAEQTVQTFASCGLPFPDKPEKRGNLVVHFNIIEEPQDDPIIIYLEVTLEQILTGCVIMKTINKKVFDLKENIISSKDVPVEIVIEKGTIKGTEFFFEKLGDIHPGRKSANVIFVVRYKKHQYFTSEGVDILYFEKITVDEAKNGIELEFPTLDNTTVANNFKKNTIVQSTVPFRFNNLGLPIVGNLDKRGDLVVHFEIVSNRFKDPPIERNLLFTRSDQILLKEKPITFYRSKFDFNGNKSTEVKNIKIKILPHDSDGKKIIFPREGNQTGPHKIPGDLIVTLQLSLMQC